MVPTKVNTSGSSLARWSSKRRMRILAAAVCLLQLASTPSAAEPEVGEARGKRRQGHPFCPSDHEGRLIPRSNPRHPAGQSGVSVVQHLELLEPVRRLPVQVLHVAIRPTRTIRPGDFSTSFSRIGPAFSGSAPTNLSIASIQSRKRRLVSRSTARVQASLLEAGLAHQPGPVRDVVAGHRSRPVPVGSGERRASPLFSRSG